MHVSERGEYLEYPIVKLHHRFQLAAFSIQPIFEQLQSLNRIDGVHRLLQWQVHVIHIEQQQRLLDNS